MNKPTYGDWLKTQRDSRRLSQSALARELGMDRSHVVKMETGSIKLPKEETRARLHAYFGTTEDDLVTAGVLARLELPGRGPVYVPSGEKPTPLVPVGGGPDVIVVSVHDPRAEVLALLEGLTTEQVSAIVTALPPILAIAGIHRDTTNFPQHHERSETA